MEGVVVALAAEGARPLDELAGLPLALRTVLTLQKEGIAAVHVVVAAGDGETCRRIAGDARVRVPVKVIEAADVGEGLVSAADAIGAPFLLARHDVVVDPAVYRALVAAEVDPAGAGAVGVEVAAARCGPLLVTPRWIRSVGATDTDTDTDTETSAGADAGALDAFVSRRSVDRIDVAGWAARVDSAAGRREAFRQLFEACRKPVDGIVARHLNRHVSIFISKRVVGCR
ncbi:MAG: hypothetical protein WKG00_12800 [Polyangiaceae bacterium]